MRVLIILRLRYLGEDNAVPCELLLLNSSLLEKPEILTVMTSLGEDNAVPGESACGAVRGVFLDTFVGNICTDCEVQFSNFTESGPP